MQRKSNAVVFLGMTYPYGAIRHFALLGCELFKASQDDADFYFASISITVSSTACFISISFSTKVLFIISPNYSLIYILTFLE